MKLKDIILNKMVLYCMDCKQRIRSPRYKYLHINNIKTNIIICVECHMMKYFLKPEQFKKHYPIIYNNEFRRIIKRTENLEQDIH